jgi:hypothetical protein
MRTGMGVDTLALDDLSGTLHACVWQLEHALSLARPHSLESAASQLAVAKATRALTELRTIATATAEGSRQYAERERFLRATAENVSSTLMWNLGRAMPALVSTFGPAMIGGVAIVLALAAARRLIPGSPFDRFMANLERGLPDSGQITSKPLVVMATAHLVSGADDFIAGALGMPKPAQHGVLAGEDLVAGAAIAGLGIVGSRSLQETQVKVSPVSSGKADPAQGYQDLISRIPRAEAGQPQIRIEQYETGYVVYLGGTIDSGVDPSGEPWDMTSNISAIAELDSGSYSSAVHAMREAGITAEDNVILVGHSQGGLVAAQLAASGEYLVSDVVTVGAPLHQVELPESVHLVAVEHTEDIIPSLSGVATPAVAVSQLTVSRSLYGAHQPPRGELLPAHNLSRYVETGAVMDKSGDSKLMAEQKRISSRTQGEATVTRWRGVRV